MGHYGRPPREERQSGLLAKEERSLYAKFKRRRYPSTCNVTK